MAHGDAREEKWRGNKKMEWVTSKRHMTAEHRLARAVQPLQADVHSSPASSRLNWRPRQFKWTRSFCRKTKSGFCACAITFQTQCTFRDNTNVPKCSQPFGGYACLSVVFSLARMGESLCAELLCNGETVAPISMNIALFWVGTAYRRFGVL